MSQKDFLSQFSGSNGKPDSFKEEIRTPIYKNKKPINIKLIVIIFAIVLTIAGVVLFLLFRPTIEMKDFVGSNTSDVSAWIRQNEIDAKGVVFKEEYDFTYDEGIVIDQSIEQGKKIRKDAKIDFVVSKGADPDELVKVPDIESMNKDELQDWVKENKLTKTKIMTAYSDTVEEGYVISYEFKSDNEDTFKRSSSLTITVSKGAKPAGVVTVENFVDKYFTEVETWAKTNKVEVVKVESYSDKTDKDKIISQSIEAKKEMKEGETLTVYVSLGKAVYAKNFVNKDIKELTNWATKNGITTIEVDEYSDDVYKEKIISQSVKEREIVKDEITVHVSLGNPVLPSAVNNMTYTELKAWIEEVNMKGADLTRVHHGEENSDTVPAGNVIRIEGVNSLEVRTGSNVKAIVSKGRNVLLKNGANNIAWENLAVEGALSEEEARSLCELQDPEISVQYKYEASSTVEVGYVISAKRSDGSIPKAGEYISQSETIIITVCEEKITTPE